MHERQKEHAAHVERNLYYTWGPQRAARAPGHSMHTLRVWVFIPEDLNTSRVSYPVEYARPDLFRPGKDLEPKWVPIAAKVLADRRRKKAV
jgi:hypothetical protein